MFMLDEQNSKLLQCVVCLFSACSVYADLIRSGPLVSPAVHQPVASTVHSSPCCLSQSPDGETPSTAEVDLFMSTQRIKVLNADTQV